MSCHIWRDLTLPEADDLLGVIQKASGRFDCHGNPFQTSLPEDGLQDSHSSLADPPKLGKCLVREVKEVEEEKKEEKKGSH